MSKLLINTVPADDLAALGHLQAERWLRSSPVYVHDVNLKVDMVKGLFAG